MTQHVGIATIVGGAALALLASATPAIAQTGAEPALALLPMPQSVVRGTGSFTVANGASIAATDAGATAAARLLADHVRTTRGLALTPGTTARSASSATPASPATKPIASPSRRRGSPSPHRGTAASSMAR